MNLKLSGINKLIVKQFYCVIMNHITVKEVFSFIEIKGCFFHLTQAIFRKMRSYPELRLKYKDRNDNFKKFIRRIQYINFLQIDVIVDIFNELVIQREIEEKKM